MVARHQRVPHLLRQMTHGRREVPRVHPHLQPEALSLPLKSADIRLAVMHVARRDMGIHDDVVFPVHRAVVQMQEALRLVVPVREAAFRVGGLTLVFLTAAALSGGFFSAGSGFFSVRPMRRNQR